jgi:hypothetical protein
MPHSPYFLYETLNHEPGMPEEPVLVIGPHMQADGSLACLILTPQYGPFPFAFPTGTLTETPFGFTWAIGNAPPAIFQLMMLQRLDTYWRARLPGPIPPFATNEDLWRWFSERYGWGWPEQPAESAPPPQPPAPAPPEPMHGGPPGLPVTPEPAPQPSLAPPMERWIELSLGNAPAARADEVPPVVAVDDFPSGLAVRWDGDRRYLFHEALEALARGATQWEAHELATLLPMTLEQAGSSASPRGWLSARLGTRANPDATAQFAVVPVEGFPHGLVLAWPAAEDAGPLFRRLADEMQQADMRLTEAEPDVPIAPQPAAASPLAGMAEEWIAFARGNRAAEDARLLTILEHGEVSGAPDVTALHALGDAAARERHAATDTAVIDWLYRDPSPARLAVVEPFLTAYAHARADQAITERVSDALANARRALPPHGPVPPQVSTSHTPSAPAPPTGAPPGIAHTQGIQVRQLPPSEDQEVQPPAPGVPPISPAPVSAAPPTSPPTPAAPTPPPAPATPPTLLLIVEDGGVERQRIPLIERITVGRHGSSQLILPDPEVSRSHAVFERDALGQITIADLSSANGIWVNGERVTRHVLRPGDHLVLGQTHLRVIEGP